MAEADTGFWGAYEHSLDDKGRVLLPVSFRDLASGKMILTCGADGAVVAQTKEDWEAISAHVRAIVVQSEVPALRRFVGASYESPIDSTHRLIVPEYLRNYAGLVAPGKALIVGVGQRFEIWDRMLFAKYGQEAFGAYTLCEESKQSGVKGLT